MIDNITSQLTGKQKVAFKPFTSLSTHIDCKETPLEYNKLNEYKIGVEWYAKIYCEPKDFPAAMENVVRELREAIYGDFRNRIIRLERAIFEWDRNQMLSEIRDIMKEIYG